MHKSKPRSYCTIFTLAKGVFAKCILRRHNNFHSASGAGIGAAIVTRPSLKREVFALIPKGNISLILLSICRSFCEDAVGGRSESSQIQEELDEEEYSRPRIQRDLQLQCVPNCTG